MTVPETGGFHYTTTKVVNETTVVLLVLLLVANGVQCPKVPCGIPIVLVLVELECPSPVFMPWASWRMMATTNTTTILVFAL